MAQRGRGTTARTRARTQELSHDLFASESLRGATPAGLESATPGSVGRCLIHWATGVPGVHMHAHTHTHAHARMQAHTCMCKHACLRMPRVPARPVVNSAKPPVGSSPRPYAYGAHALPTELRRLLNHRLLLISYRQPSHSGRIIGRQVGFYGQHQPSKSTSDWADNRAEPPPKLAGNSPITKPYRTVPYGTVPYGTEPYHTVPYGTVRYRSARCRTVRYRTVPYRTVLR